MTRHAAGFLLMGIALLAQPCFAGQAAGNLPPTLTPMALLQTFHIKHLLEYSCAEDTRCEIRCSGSDSKSEFHYMDVKRLEIAPGAKQWLLTAAHLDAVGKAHRSSAMLPVPVSCMLDDLNLDRVSDYSDGQLTRPDTDQKVIFDVEPQPHH